ncbi:outer membrane protein assembly factor BamC [Schlegelella sp. ID0723]|uniref:Outer membrane protein assembly factor BamC n=2 Tax=Piscinibacter koreensis TaxID=2742824 RepID=A0A7Y6TVE7_9BURK|nr:outer membrane protein assembly factor BamC [Schlegelella koreensis]NUZ05029.1 outer membrane protein assembly factor BamC [Schlegelella koreensis]
MAGDKVDYRSGAERTNGLEVPPDLTQLSRDTRFQAPGGTVSASTYQTAASAPPLSATPTGAAVAPKAVGDFRIERLGNERWLSTTLPPEQLYPQVRSFWRDAGFTLVTDLPDAGVLETNWAENRAKLPRDFIRSTIGRVFDGLYSTGELDKFRTRIERTPTGSDVYITHRGMVEVYQGERRESTVWQARPTDPQLEAEFLSRLMVRLGQKEEVARATVDAAAAAPAGPARARLVSGRPAATLQVDDNFDRAWRRVGLALDRSGFTVEDRDRAQGLYYVRYVDPDVVRREEPGFLARMFSFGRASKDDTSLARYRVHVASDGATSTVTVQNAQGAPENGTTGQRIVSLLLEDLK